MRAMTVADADALFREIALLTVKIAKIEAGYEKKIADPNTGIEPTSLMFPALAGRFFTTSATW